ncbi:TWiK family of potassium channels protein 7-like protein [Leptotrombidium deliense]|uniref:TWiK family of potassium channels protein 7-like protein n=1 Tax=Leptotrombidium deliense TaxID=299467 RepID=A0A443SQ97_9ACAR|nr:TWiK family of potassium channels protein 7-like protein [Leptotrombidium deliense]
MADKADHENRNETVGVVVNYLGAYIFRHYEAPHERSVTSDVLALRNTTIKNLWNITDKYNILYKKNWTLMVTLEIEKFQSEIIKAVRDGFDGKTSADGKPHQWSLSSAFLYSLTVITTIGELLYCRDS